MEQSELLTHLIRVFDRLKLDYFFVGSIAASYFGEPRFTNDIDVVVRLVDANIQEFCRAFPAEKYYLSEEAVRSAVANQRQFNILLPANGLKVDIFVLDDSAFEQSRFRRREQYELEAGQTAWFARPEDVILKKLVYYGEGNSEKHIRDILGVLRIQEDSIDLHYIANWADQLGLFGLWQDVLARINSQDTTQNDAG